VPTPSERRALLFVAAVAALGLGVRGLRVVAAGQGPATPAAALAAQIAAVDSAVSTGGRPRRAKAAPPRTGPQALKAPQAPLSRDSAVLDVDQADVDALDRLPGIGPALARRIVEDRDANGPFGSVDGLQRVRGIGPALAARLAPLVTFSGVPRQAPRP